MSNAQLPVIAEPRLPYHPGIEERFNIDKTSWRALVESTFPTASSGDSVILALSYCKARNLDPFKRVVHIVPIWDKRRKCMVDTVWPGIAEYRTTAFRTGTYAGKDRTEVGEALSENVGGKKVKFPEWMSITVYRLVAGQRIAFPGPRVYWLETFGSTKDGSPNSMWATRPFGMLEKCAEAAALRCAFPEELGGEPTADEMGGATWHGRAVLPAESTPVSSTLTPKLASPTPDNPPPAADGEIPLPEEATEPLNAPEQPQVDGAEQDMRRQEYMDQLGEATTIGRVTEIKEHAAANTTLLSAETISDISQWCEERANGIRTSRGRST